MEKHSGYFTFYWEAKTGKIWLEIDKWDTEFLYVNSLPAGVGSNDIVLNRGQLAVSTLSNFSASRAAAPQVAEAAIPPPVRLPWLPLSVRPVVSWQLALALPYEQTSCWSGESECEERAQANGAKTTSRGLGGGRLGAASVCKMSFWRNPFGFEYSFCCKKDISNMTCFNPALCLTVKKMFPT